MSLLPVGLGSSQTDYSIPRSLRFRLSNLTSMFRTNSVAGNRRTFTWSAWVRKGYINVETTLIGTADTGAPSGGDNTTNLRFLPDGQLRFVNQVGGSTTILVDTNIRFQDASAYYHIMLSVDTTKPVSTDGVRIYINGKLCPATYSVYVQNTLTFINTNAYAQYIGMWSSLSPKHHFDGFLADVVMVDGQALGPVNFGAIDPITEEWVPRKYTGTYGTNGYYLDFRDGASLATLGNDKSGNGNNFSLVNFGLGSGVTNDWTEDSPTNTYPIFSVHVALGPNQGNLYGANCAWQNFGFAAWNARPADNALPRTGKWYFEVDLTYTGTNPYASVGGGMVGIHTGNVSAAPAYPGSEANTYGYHSPGNAYNNGVSTSMGGVPWGNNSTIMVALDADLGQIWFGFDGVWRGPGTGNPGAGRTPVYSGIPTATTDYFPCVAAWGISPDGDLRYFLNTGGVRPFKYGPPAGFLAPCAKNYPEPLIVNGRAHMDVRLRVGTGTDTTISGLKFKPGLVWTKGYLSASAAYSHAVFDVARSFGPQGGNYMDLASSEPQVAAPFTGPATRNPDGYQLLGGATLTNQNTASYIDYLMEVDEPPVANTAGTVTSQVYKSTKAGFSIVKFSPPASGGFSVGHGLGKKPDFFIVKAFTSPASGWVTWHAVMAGTRYVLINSNAIQVDNSSVFSAAPTATVLNLGLAWLNPTWQCVAYCWYEVPGYSKVSHYVGTNSAWGPFIYCGFKPRFVMIKSPTISSDWQIYDSERNPYNRRTRILAANSNGPEGSNVSIALDFYANGYRVRTSDGYNPNVSNQNYIAIAFADTPSKYSRAA